MKEKGKYGYLNSYMRNKLITVTILSLMILFIVVTLHIMFGTTSRVMVVFAILLSLPLAKFLIAYLICAKFKSLTKQQYQYIESKTEDKNCIMYDIVVSQYEGLKFYQSVFVKNGKIIGLVLSKDYKEEKNNYVKWLKQTHADTKYEYNVTVFSDIDQYLKKINSISQPNDNNKVIDRHITEKILETGV